MPRPRFHKLPADKQRRILECAAAEFGAHGLDGASLNRIIEKAGISKGAVYYYFDDKTDLLATVLEWTIDELLGTSRVEAAALTRESFWPSLQALYEQSTARARHQPWAVAVHRRFHNLPVAVRESGPLARVQDSVATWLRKLLVRGQELGVVRADLPGELLVSLALALDEAADRWILERWDSIPPHEMDAMASKMFDILKRLFEPSNAHPPGARARRR